jgi:hypothetical protein
MRLRRAAAAANNNQPPLLVRGVRDDVAFATSSHGKNRLR